MSLVMSFVMSVLLCTNLSLVVNNHKKSFLIKEFIKLRVKCYLLVFIDVLIDTVQFINLKHSISFIIKNRFYNRSLIRFMFSQIFWKW